MKIGLASALASWTDHYQLKTLEWLIILNGRLKNTDSISSLRKQLNTIRRSDYPDCSDIRSQVISQAISSLCEMAPERKAIAEIESLYRSPDTPVRNLSRLFLTLCEANPDTFPDLLPVLDQSNWPKETRYRQSVINSFVHKVGITRIANRLKFVRVPPKGKYWFFQDLFQKDGLLGVETVYNNNVYVAPKDWQIFYRNDITGTQTLPIDASQMTDSEYRKMSQQLEYVNIGKWDSAVYYMLRR